MSRKLGYYIEIDTQTERKLPLALRKPKLSWVGFTVELVNGSVKLENCPLKVRCHLRFTQLFFLSLIQWIKNQNFKGKA